MPHTTTDARGETGISPLQERALEALLSGVSVAEASRAEGVDRATVHRWLRSDPAFQVAFNQARTAMRAAAEGRLETLASKALDVIAYALDQSDPKTAIAVLRGVGLLSGTAAATPASCACVIRPHDATRQRRPTTRLCWPSSGHDHRAGAGPHSECGDDKRKLLIAACLRDQRMISSCSGSVTAPSLAPGHTTRARRTKGFSRQVRRELAVRDRAR